MAEFTKKYVFIEGRKRLVLRREVFDYEIIKRNGEIIAKFERQGFIYFELRGRVHRGKFRIHPDGKKELYQIRKIPVPKRRKA